MNQLNELTIEIKNNDFVCITQALQRKNIGYVFQNYGLIENRSVKANIDIVTKFLKIEKQEKSRIICFIT